MKEKKVSIIIPVYNQELYLDISIPSVLNQEYKNIDIVIVNDGSTDNSGKIITKYKNKDSRIKVITKQNGGLVDAVIEGIKNATGELICFLDSDDCIGSDYVQNFIQNIGECDFLAMGYCSEYINKIDKISLYEDKKYSKKEILFWKNKFLFDFDKESVSKQFYISRWNKIYKKDLLMSIIPKYENCKSVSLGEDTLFTYLVLCNSSVAKTATFVNSYYYNKKSQTSMTSTGSIQKHFDKSIQAFKIFKNMLLENKDNDDQAYLLLYCLMESLIQRVQKENSKNDFIMLVNNLKQNKDYVRAVNIIKRNTNLKRKILLQLRFTTPRLFLLLKGK